MTTLSIWKFTSPAGAEGALRTLSKLQDQRLIVVQDASVVSWPEGRRKPRTSQACDVSGSAALSGAFWGLSDDFLDKVRNQITPGNSTLFLLTSDEVVDRVHDAFAGVHAELLVTNLSRDEEDALRAAFDDDDAEEPAARSADTH